LKRCSCRGWLCRSPPWEPLSRTVNKERLFNDDFRGVSLFSRCLVFPVLRLHIPHDTDRTCLPEETADELRRLTRIPAGTGTIRAYSKPKMKLDEEQYGNLLQPFLHSKQKYGGEKNLLESPNFVMKDLLKREDLWYNLCYGVG